MERLTADLGNLPAERGSAQASMKCSPNGRWVSYAKDKSETDGRRRSGRAEIWLQPVDGGVEKQLTYLGANINTYSWAPDSSRIVLSGTRYGSYDIYLVEVPSGETVRLTKDPLFEVNPMFTPSGDHILYVKLDETWVKREIIMMTLEGKSPRTVVGDTGFIEYGFLSMTGRVFLPLVSPNGETVVFPSYRSGWINYWQAPLRGGEPKPIYKESSDQSDAAFSPDGRLLALVSNSNGTKRLKAVPVNPKSSDDSVRVLVDPELGVVSNPAWSPDGTQLAYLFETPKSLADLWLVSLQEDAPRQLTSSPLSKVLVDRLVDPVKVKYRSFDGLEISAYLYAPPNRKPNDRFPGLILVHGGWWSQIIDTYHPDVQYFVRKGYVVLMPNFRGGGGYGKKFEELKMKDWGHGDLQDAIAGAEYLKTLDYVDKDNIGIHGTSYGGFLSMAAVAFAPGIFQASVPHGGGTGADRTRAIPNPLDLFQQELIYEQIMRLYCGDPEEDKDVYVRCSPIYHLDNATTPTFIVAGDSRHPPRNDGLSRFANALERRYKTFEYKEYPNEGHYVRSMENRLEFYPDIVDFLDRYLKKPHPQ